LLYDSVLDQQKFSLSKYSLTHLPGTTNTSFFSASFRATKYFCSIPPSFAFWPMV
jgi:hypothetical protein